MAMSAISKHLFCRFYSYSHRQLIIGSQTNSFYLWTHFDSRFYTELRRYYCNETKWITMIFEKSDGSHLKRKGTIGTQLYEVLYKDSEFPGYATCEGTKGCSTCHVIFTKEDFDIIKKYNSETESEGDLLDEIAKQFSSSDVGFRTDTSRLGCCITLIPEMDGMVIKLPKTKSFSDS